MMLIKMHLIRYANEVVDNNYYANNTKFAADEFII
jgi:hypothetical protein